MINLTELYDNLNDICVEYCVNKWSTTGDLFLITQCMTWRNQNELEYRDHVMEIKIESSDTKSRIDIYWNNFHTSVRNHKFWLIYTDKEWLCTKCFVEDLVKHQYKTIMIQFYHNNYINGILQGAYYDKKPDKMYSVYENKLREQKLKRIIQ